MQKFMKFQWQYPYSLGHNNIHLLTCYGYFCTIMTKLKVGTEMEWPAKAKSLTK